ncbi:neurobeachin/beige protein, putative [Trypanosoma equiperdum]|uniref:Neurobeachin/beige protein, putative n=1 Tax=Trypanosoma equiperdum TaxID=5694 RepID=A0A1G4ILC1_TRYEQ|nr:neurobeachin/beige protein, putative [Trypanosoma equiperdum]
MFKFLDTFVVGRSMAPCRDTKRKDEHEAEYRVFLNHSAASEVKDELERLVSSGSKSSFPYPLSSDTGLELSVLRLIQSNGACRQLPAKMLSLMLKRLEYACTKLGDTAKINFLRDSIPVLEAALLVNPLKVGLLMLELGFDRHMLHILQFLRQALSDEKMGGSSVSHQVSDSAAGNVSTPLDPSDDIPLEYSEGGGDEDVVTATRTCFDSCEPPRATEIRYRELLTILRDTLRVLKVVYVRCGPSKRPSPGEAGVYSDMGNATGISNSQLAKGWVRLRPDSLYAEMHKRSCPAEERKGSTSGSTLRTHTKRDGILLECSRLCLHCSEVAIGSVERGGEEERTISEALCNLPLVVLSLLRNPSELVVRNSLISIGAELTHFVAVERTGDSELQTLRQASCSMLLLSRLLRESPLLVVKAMNSVNFSANVVRLLQVISVRYHCVHCDGCRIAGQEECARELRTLADAGNDGLHLDSGCVVSLKRPAFTRLADNAVVDEFLHCYLGLLETQREVRRTAEVHRDLEAARHFMQMEFSLLEALLHSGDALAPTSCLYDALMKYAINSLAPMETPVQERRQVNTAGSLVDADFYRVVFLNPVFGVFQKDPRLQHAVLYLLHHRLNSLPPKAESSDGGAAIENEVGLILDLLCSIKVGEQPTESVEGEAAGAGDDNEKQNRGGVVARQEELADVLLKLCVIFHSSLCGTNSDAVATAVIRCGGISKLVGLLRECYTSGRLSGDGISMLVLHLLLRLLQRLDVQCSVLMGEVDIFFSLLSVKEIRPNAKRMLLLLYTHSCPDAEYTQRMDQLVKCTWDALDKCARLESGCEADNEDEEMFLSVLNCMSASLSALRSDIFQWGSMRQLQNALCGGKENAMDAFLRLFHRTAAPWRVVDSSYGLSCIMNTVVMLVKENPPLRAVLIHTIGADQLVESFKTAWFTSHNGSWLQFIRCMLLLVYEDDEAHVSAAVGSVGPSCGFDNGLDGRRSVVGGEEGTLTVRNPELLLPLLRLFLDLPEFKEDHRDALQCLVTRLSSDVMVSQSSLWMVANAGVFDSLTALIPVVAGTALIDSVLSLVMAIAGHHVTVRETKQFLMSIAHAKSEEERRFLVPIVIEVLSAASRHILNCQATQQNYIAFRQHNGPTGLKAILSDFPLDAYTLCLWIRLETHGGRRTRQCIYSLQSIEKRTILELVVKSNGQLAVSYDVEHNKATEVDLGCQLAALVWTHLTVVHSQSKFPFSASEFVVFVNGVEVCAQPSVRYPQLQGLFFHVGTRGEDIEQRTSSNNFVGQVAAVHFFTCALSPKSVLELFLEKSGGESVRRGFFSGIAVYVDPRFGERGQLHNLAALLRGKPTERPLITYEGTVACNTKSIMDSVCVLGALQTVVIPLLVLLVNPQLPFYCRVPPGRRRPASEATRKAMNELLKFVEALLLSNIVRADVLEVGLFPMISHAVQQFTVYDCPELPRRLYDICVALVSDEALFDAAYHSLFLSGDLLHVCSEPTQLLLLQVQYLLCHNNAPARRHLRGLDLPHFVVGQIMQTYNGTSEHHREMREGFFLLMEAVMEGGLTMNDADAIQRLVSVMLRKQDLHRDVLIEILVRTRVLVANREPNLASFLGKRNFVKDLLPALNNSPREVRNEVVLFFILLASRSRKTQELLNPTLLASREAVHVTRDISLSWLRDKLNDCAVDVSLYTTLLAALIGRFDVSLQQDVTITADDKICFAPVLTPLLLLMKRTPNKVMKEKVMTDIATLVQQDSVAWRSILSVQGWYASIAELYLSDAESLEARRGEQSLFMATTAFIFSRTIFQALIQESYGASELELLITYLFRRRANVFLNAVLLGVVKEYTSYLTNRRDDNTGGCLSLGSQLALANFTAFLSVVEDVLFYSTTAYINCDATRPADAHRKRGYSEEEELVVFTDEGMLKLEFCEGYPEGSEYRRDEMLQNGVSFLSGDSMLLRTAPDGVWLHAALAVRTMQLLTTSGAILNSTGTWNNSFSSSSGNGGSAPGSDAVPQGLRPRKGGFIRLFVRLFRVVCGFTLRDAAQLDDILSLALRWVDVVDNDYSPFALLMWQWSEVKEHSPLSSSMTLILSLHELLNRRLRFSLLGPSLRFPDANQEILRRMKAICILHKRDLNQMQFFSRTVPSSVGEQTVKQCTLEWLCGRSGEDSMKEFVEVASREDYEAFISQCTLAMERDQLTDKSMARTIEQYHSVTMARLHGILTDFSISRRTMLEVLEQHLQDGTEGEGDDAAGGVESSAERFATLAVREVATVFFNTVWARFLSRCRGTIWDVGPGEQRNMKYVRLQDVEQKLLIRRKFEFDPCGTDHANITAAGAPVSDTKVFGKQLPRARGGEQMLLTSDSSVDCDEILDKQVSHEDTNSITGTNTAQTPKPIVHFSSSCEVPSMMHCWSAMLIIRDCELCVFFDDENKAYNQRVADEASSLVVKPRDIIYPTGHIAQLAPGRRFRMRRSAVEMWFRDGRSVLLNFASVKEMRTAVNRIRMSVERHKVPYHPFYLFHETPRKEPLLMCRTNQWREHKISNFEYLLWLNFFGGRTVNDLTQYPVFPWVIADYKSDRLDLEKSSTFRDLSLPIGICNGPQSREYVETRYEEMRQTGDVPAHYFTHYSSPAVVLYYMIRVEPFTTLQVILQDGHFDCADRMFHSLASCWNGVLTNSQDVRELIPELFYLPEMCVNTNGIRFGCRQDGRPTDSLELPPWAHGDPYEFVYRMREALESDYVSLNLHHWIDLIFGYKQRGKEAIAALNVFNWHSYEDLDRSQTDDVDERLLIDSLDNIGQTPIQLFTRPHVERRAMEYADPISCVLGMRAVDIRHLCTRVARVVVLDNDRVLVVCGNGAALLYRISVSPVMRRMQQLPSPAVTPTLTTPRVGPVADGNVKSHFSNQTPAPSVAAAVAHTSSYLLGIVSGAPVAPVPQGSVDGSGFRRPIVDVAEDFERRIPPLPPGMIPNIGQKAGGPCETGNVAVLLLDNEVFVALGGVFDNTIVIRNFLTTPAFQEERLHAHCGRVVLVAASADSRYLVSGAEDTTFIVWSCHFQRNRLKLRVDLMFTVYGHEDDPTAVSVCPILDVVATASRDGMLMLHSLANNRLERSLRHPAKLPIDRVLIQPNCYLPNILFTSTIDNVIHQISINGVLLRSVSAPGRITGWCTTPKQTVLVSTAPLTNTSASEDSRGILHFMHAFHLNVLKSVQCPLPATGDTISSCACHSSNPQAVVCGSTHGYLSLLCLGSKVDAPP